MLLFNDRDLKKNSWIGGLFGRGLLLWISDIVEELAGRGGRLTLAKKCRYLGQGILERMKKIRE